MKNYNPFLLMLVCSTAVITHTAGQHTVANASLTELLFSSPGYIDGLNYGADTTRDYRFQTYYPNHTLILTVKEFVMEPDDKNGDCLYDKVTIYDGYNQSSPVLQELCGNITAGTSYQTSGDTVYVLFYSDDKLPFKGFQMSVVSDGPTTTTSTTTTSTTSTTSTTTSTTTPTTTSTASNNQPTTTNSPVTTGNNQKSSDGDSGPDYKIWVIVGCCVGGLLLIILVVTVIICLKKAKRPVTPNGSSDHVKRVLWSRSNTTMVKPIDVTKTSVPPGEVIQTNIFDVDLPSGGGKANLLPPLSSKLEPPSRPVIYGADTIQ